MSSKRYAIPLSLLVAAALLLPAGGLASTGSFTSAPGSASPQLLHGTSNGPVLFIENAGQWPDAARFQVWGGRQVLWLAEDALWITILGRDEASPEDLAADRVPWMDDRFPLEQASPGMPNPYTVGVNIRLSFPRANPHPRLEPFDRLETHVSYVNGNDPEDWRVDVPVWGGVRYVDIYPGVDLIVGAGTALGLDDGRLQPPSQLGGRWSALRWRVEAREGANLAAVRLRVEGANAVTVDKNILHLSTAAGNLALPLPAADRTNKERVKVTRLDAQAFDVIAPLALARTKVTASTAAWHAATSPQSGGLPYATFLGSSLTDIGRGIAVDSAGQAYITGHTWSAEFPASLGPGYDTSFNGGEDAFVVKLDAAGARLLYATFLGGSGWDEGYGIAVDGAGQAYVTGYTESADFPASLGPGYDTSFNGDESQFDADAFVVKLDAAGISLSTATPTATPTSTPTPTATPTGPWASWAQGDRPLLVPPAGAAAVVNYGNLAPPVPFMAHVTGAAIFDTGAISGTTSISTTLATSNGSYAMRLIPTIGATGGQTLTIRAEIVLVTLTKDGWIARQVWLPLILRR